MNQVTSITPSPARKATDIGIPQALEWYTTLFDNGDSLLPTEIRCIHPHKTGKQKVCGFWGVLETTEDCQKLAELNRQGYGIYAVVNQPAPSVQERVRNKQAARDEDIAGVNALFIEIDKDESEAGANFQELLNAPLPPTMIVRSSSANHLHAYWRVTDLPLEEFRAFEVQLIERFGAGTESKNPSRVLRIPGFLHTKGAPVRSELLKATGLVYTRAQIIDAFEIDPSLTINLEPYPLPENWGPPDGITDRILEAARHQANKLKSTIRNGGNGRHGKLHWAALSCLENHLPLPEAIHITRKVADMLPPRENSKAVPHNEADSVCTWVYKNCAPGKPWDLEAPWGEPQQLPPLTAEVPILPKNLFPEPLQAFLEDAADRLCVHREFIAVPLICALGSIIGRSLGIHPKQLDDWLETPNLWGALVGNPSTRKTPALKEATGPLQMLAGKAREIYEQKVFEKKAEKEVIKLEIDQLKHRARSKSEVLRDVQAELQEKLQALKESEVAEKRYLTNDSTTEKLGELLNQNPRGLLVLTDELARWLKSFEKPGREGDRAFYLESWNGTGSFSIDRIGRGSIYVPALTLSICGTIQPGALQSYIHGAIEGGGQADGLLQRIQLLVYPDKPRPFKLVDKQPDVEARKILKGIFEFLDNLKPNFVGAETNPYKPDGIPALRFTEDTQQAFNGWLEQLLNRVQAPDLEPFPAFQAHLGKYPALVARLALIFHLVFIATGEHVGPVSDHALGLALGWAAFLEKHARKVYALELHHDLASAHALAERIEKGSISDGQAIRAIYRAGWSFLKSPDEVTNAIQVLEELNWVRREIRQASSQGGRPSEVIRLHPEVQK